jgi:hypothetical protein
MKKLTLKLENLSVESFQPEQRPDRGGTVVGQNHTSDGGLEYHTYGNQHTCVVSECGYSCLACDTEHDPECSSHCIIPTYTWEPC